MLKRWDREVFGQGEKEGKVGSDAGQDERLEQVFGVLRWLQKREGCQRDRQCRFRRDPPDRSPMRESPLRILTRQ